MTKKFLPRMPERNPWAYIHGLISRRYYGKRENLKTEVKRGEEKA